MFTQHLTVVQSRHLFIGKDCIAYRCDQGLPTSDLVRFDLRPIIVVTLSVENFAIYWQRLFFADEPIPLSSFLYLAWIEFHNLGGLPERLLVQPELLEQVRHALRQLDPGKVVKQLEPGRGWSFGSTKKQSQGLPKHCIEPDVEVSIPSSPLNSQHATLARMNERLETYHRKWQYRPKPGRSDQADQFDEHLHRELHFPQWPRELLEVLTEEWMQHVSASAPVLRPAENLETASDFGWCKVVNNYWWLTKKPPLKQVLRTIGDSPSPDPSLLYWVDDLLWFKSTVRALPYQFDTLFGSIIEPPEFEDFLSGRNPVNGIVANRLYQVVSRENRPGLVLFPDSAQAFEDAVKILGEGGDERCCAELVGSYKVFPYRIFALDDDYRLNILAVPRDSYVNDPSLRTFLHQTLGEIDVGAPGFAAINYWLEHLISGRPKEHSLIMLEMVQSMLETIPLWVEAGRPADNQ
ncbi:hypothetical protein [Pseudomonas sp. NPDC089569]|uniref:hypothetical protein n=1 Tax=Pseudomonas sp. NPDC089569 TaxID=3390722 RepID=UPI003D07F177